jgi:hypothetical protein
MIRRSAAMLLTIAVGASFLAAPAQAGKPKEPPRGKTWLVDFRSDTLGIAPPGSVVMGGSWAVLEDSSSMGAGSGGTTSASDSSRSVHRVLRQRSGDDAVAANWIRFEKPTLKRCEVSVRFRVVSGELDPGAGIAFQLDPKGRNGYLVRVSGASNQVIAHYILGGKRRDIKMQRVQAPVAGAWHTLGVRREGIWITVLYDGKETMKLRDERFDRGGVGLWTEDDSVVDFADLTLTAR